MIKIAEIYDEYIKQLNEINKEERYDGNESWYHASDSGGCIKKIQFGIRKAKSDPFEERIQRVMRLGELIHRDIQESIEKKYLSLGYSLTKDDNGKTFTHKSGNHIILIESNLEMPDINVRGFLDIAEIDFANNQLIVYDIKSSAAYKWKKLFGRDPEPSNGMYEKQISTYCYGLGKKFNMNNQMSFLYWYKKDNSMVKTQPVPTFYIKEAIQYWELVAKMIELDLEPGIAIGCPFHSWECNYCRYQSSCNSPLIKKKRK